jgi:hypothetical protein
MRTMRFIGPEQKGSRPAYEFRTRPERGRLDRAAWLRRGSLIVFAAVLFTNVSSYWVNGVEGVLILVVVGATSLVRREASIA